MLLIVAFGGQRQMDLPEPKANLVYIEISNLTDLYNETLSQYRYTVGWGCSSVTEHLPSLYKDQDLQRRRNMEGEEEEEDLTRYGN